MTGLLSTAKSISPNFTIVPSSGIKVTTPAIGLLSILLSVCLNVPLYSSFFSRSPCFTGVVVSCSVLFIDEDSVFWVPK